MEKDSSHCDHRFFLPIKSPFHRRLISRGLAGPANREPQRWQDCGQPRLGLPFNESFLVPAPITNLPAPWWIIIRECAQCPQTASTFLCAEAWAYNKGLFVVWLLLLIHWIPRGSPFSLKANWPSDFWRFERSVRSLNPVETRVID